MRDNHTLRAAYRGFAAGVPSGNLDVRRKVPMLRSAKGAVLGDGGAIGDARHENLLQHIPLDRLL
jgi:hypothetical protein